MPPDGGAPGPALPTSSTGPSRPRAVLGVALVVGLVLLLGDEGQVGSLASSRSVRKDVAMTRGSTSASSSSSGGPSSPATASPPSPPPPHPPRPRSTRCECKPDSQRFVVVSPCAGLVNQHYAIAHAALLAGGLGADVYIEDMSTRSSFSSTSPLYVEDRRLPTADFHELPKEVPGGRFTVALHDALPPELAGCAFPEDSFYRRHARLAEVQYVIDKHLAPSCGVRVGCSFYGVNPANENERLFLVDVLRALQPTERLRALGDAVIARLRKENEHGEGGWGGGLGYAAVHLRVEPDMNNGKILPVPRADVKEQLQRIGVPFFTPVYVASGVSAQIMEDLPEGYKWYNRDDLLEWARADAEARGDERGLQALSVDGLAAEQIALVDLWVCQHADAFVGDVRSTFSVAVAVIKKGEGIGWYYGSLDMWAADSVKLGLPPPM